MRASNCCNGLCIVATGLTAILAGALANIVTLNVAGVLMSVFTILFGAVLCCFELRTASSDRITRTYCGFMYSFWGRLLFLLLCVNRRGGVWGGGGV